LNLILIEKKFVVWPQIIFEKAIVFALAFFLSFFLSCSIPFFVPQQKNLLQVRRSQVGNFNDKSWKPTFLFEWFYILENKTLLISKTWRKLNLIQQLWHWFCHYKESQTTSCSCSTIYLRYTYQSFTSSISWNMFISLNISYLLLAKLSNLFHGGPYCFLVCNFSKSAKGYNCVFILPVCTSSKTYLLQIVFYFGKISKLSRIVAFCVLYSKALNAVEHLSALALNDFLKFTLSVKKEENN